MTTEEKLVPIYDGTAKKEVPTKTEVMTDLIGQEITVGILQILENKTKWDASTKTRTVLPETQKINQLDKVFRTRDHMTVAEVRAQATEPAFYAAWGEKNTGVTRDKTKTPTAGAVGGGGAVAGKPKTSLFA